MHECPPRGHRAIGVAQMLRDLDSCKVNMIADVQWTAQWGMVSQMHNNKNRKERYTSLIFSCVVHGGGLLKPVMLSLC